MEHPQNQMSIKVPFISTIELYFWLVGFANSIAIIAIIFNADYSWFEQVISLVILAPLIAIITLQQNH